MKQTSNESKGADARQPIGGFIKGTRLHTKEGLKPIEEIKVGDWVLSSPEEGSGSPEYKRVVRTLKHEQQTIVCISIHPEGWKFPDPFYFIAATGNHPFWVEVIGWTRADALQCQQWLQLGDGGRAFIGGVQPVYRTDQEGIGWTTEQISLKGSGTLFDYANYTPVNTEKSVYLASEVIESDDPYLRVTVYTLAVEDFYTYYVGAKGFWVRGFDMDREGVHLQGDPSFRGKDMQAGLIAGTLIHTQDGIRPIEQIKVGDWVLSSPEDGAGSAEYKRVVRTLKYGPQLVFNISICPRWVFPDPGYFVVVTGSHPFCVEGMGWTRADELMPQQWLRQGNGGRAYVASTSRVYRTGQDGIGWVSNGRGTGGEGSVFDYANYVPVDEFVEDKFCYLPDDVLASRDPYLRIPVFNLEVEDFGTYYVGGKHGFWVKGANSEAVPSER
ncbi:polymorphic toxin-type HINT domain-containing protein [Pseudomonas benzopyrenica]|uniref:polymorphic toxin-type HINT domain-containing protein n=1 Tax=Pseudomonas benzopyrenica TaxID=2993566 RepID=UPI003F6CE6B9